MSVNDSLSTIGQLEDRIDELEAELDQRRFSVIHVHRTHVPVDWIRYGNCSVGVDANGCISEIRFGTTTAEGRE